MEEILQYLAAGVATAEGAFNVLAQTGIIPAEDVVIGAAAEVLANAVIPLIAQLVSALAVKMKDGAALNESAQQIQAAGEAIFNAHVRVITSRMQKHLVIS